MGFVQNNCSKERLKLLGRSASVLVKEFNMDVLINNKLGEAKIKTMQGKISFLQCRC